MRILVLIHEYPPVGGGGGKVAQDICTRLVKKGHEVRVITSRLRGLPHEADDHGAGIIRVPCGRKHAYKAGFLDMALFILASLQRGLKEIRDWKPDVMHVHFAVPAGVTGWMLSLLTGTPYLLTAHLGDVPGGVPEKTDKWFRWVAPFTPGIWKRAKKVVAVSSFTRDLAAKRYPVKMYVILNGVDTQEYDPGTVHVNKPPQILFVGRIVQQKNPLQIVRTLAEIKDLEWECAIVGDGEMRREMEIEAANLELTDRIRFAGWVTPDEVKEWFNRSDILFMPSYSEGLPVVGVQALSMGLAFVVGEVGGFIDLVEEGMNGWMHEPEDTGRFSGSLRILLEDPGRLLRYRLNSREKAVEFDLDQIVGEYEVLLKDVAEKNARM